ncbi:MAG: hypothetical protein J2P19_35745 [Pseudonocardia sp.]|nr:hypothetical protein [Pseudonocardia sp.]
MSEPSALEWVARLRAGELSAREPAEHYLHRMWAADERVHAVLACDPQRVLAQADAADRASRPAETCHRCSGCRSP